MALADSQSETELMQVGAVIEAVYHAASSVELYRSIVEILPRFFKADRASITVYHADTQEIEFVAIHGLVDSGERMQLGKRMQINKTYEQYHASVSVADIWSPDSSDGGNSSDRSDGEESAQSPKRSLRDLGLVSVMNAPFYDRDVIVGTINIASKQASFTDENLSLLVQISRLIGIAAERIRNTDKQAAATSRHRLYAQHLELLNDLGEKLSLAGDTDEAFNLISVFARELVDAVRVSYCVLEPDLKNIRIIGLIGATTDKRGQVLSLERSGLEDILIGGRQRYTTDLLQSSSESQKSLGQSGFNHLWSTPIVSAGKIIGALNISSKVISLDPGDATSVIAALSRFLGSTLQRIEAQQQTLQMMGEIELRARTDMLTGLPNRSEFHYRLQEELLRADECGALVGVFFLDLDLFKNVNDTLGHAVGDQLLCDLSRRLEQLVGEQGTVARIGGDEFLVMSPGIESRNQLEFIGLQLIEKIRQPLEIGGRTLEVGVSIGAVCYPQDGADGEELIKNADIAMYHAKALGRNQCQVFNDVLASSVGRRVRLESLLRDAIANQQLSLVFQPQFDFASDRVISVEALLRWNHPQEGFIPPDEFIGIAEQCGIVSQLTDWVVAQSLMALKSLRRTEPDLRVAVNVSASEFSSHSDLFERVTAVLHESGLPANALELELTETALLSHPEHASALIAQLSAEGIQLAIDDFGTGYASLSYLIQLPINTIKIDRTFVDGVDRDERKQSVVAGILAIAGGMGLHSVGEGVETPDELNWLIANGCDSAQGFYLGRPVKAEEIPLVISELSQVRKAA